MTHKLCLERHSPWKGRDYSYFLLFTMGMHCFIGSLLGHIFIYVYTVVWSYLTPHSLLTTPSPQISSYIYVFEIKKQRGECLTMLPWLAWNSLCGLGWSWTHKRFTYLCLPNAKKAGLADQEAPELCLCAFPALRLQACASTPNIFCVV